MRPPRGSIGNISIIKACRKNYSGPTSSLLFFSLLINIDPLTSPQIHPTYGVRAVEGAACVACLIWATYILPGVGHSEGASRKRWPWSVTLNGTPANFNGKNAVPPPTHYSIYTFHEMNTTGSKNRKIWLDNKILKSKVGGHPLRIIT